MLAPEACITSNAVTQSFCCFLIPWIRLHVCWRVGSFFSLSLDSRICGTAESPERLKPGSHLRHNDITGRSRKPKQCLVLMFYVFSVNNIS